MKFEVSFLAGLLAASIPSGVALGSGQLFVTTTNYEITGSTSRMQMEAPWETTLDEYVVHSDAVVRSDGRYVYILNRFGADNVLVLDAANDYSVVTQFSVAATGRNPRDIAVVSPGRAYVSLYESNSLLVVDPLTGARLGTVDLSHFADADGLAEVDQIERLGDRLFVAVQRRLRNAGWTAAGGAGVVVVDTITDSVVDADPVSPGLDLVATGLENPFWRMQHDPGRQRLMVACSGDFLALDGGLVEVNPFTLRAEEVIVTEQALGGDLLDFALVDDRRGYALVGQLDFDTCLVAFDPSTGSVTANLLCTDGFWLNDLELGGDGNLYVGDRTATAPGVRVFDAGSGQLVAGPIDVGLPPFDLLPIASVVTASTPPVAGVGRLEAFPNPFNPRVEIRLETALERARAHRLDILDARGRRVAAIAGRRVGTAVVWTWNGADDQRRPVASGVYYARPPVEGVAPLPLTLVR